jgi:hypothetical protein
MGMMASWSFILSNSHSEITMATGQCTAATEVDQRCALSSKSNILVTVITPVEAKRDRHRLLLHAIARSDGTRLLRCGFQSALVRSGSNPVIRAMSA